MSAREGTQGEAGHRPLSLLLKAGDRLFLNGAVIRADRKVRIEVLNDATFLLGTHLLQVEDARTPLRQLYYAVQTLLIEPDSAAGASVMAQRMLASQMMAFGNRAILDGLREVERDLARGKPYPALKILRSLFAVEDRILAGETAQDSNFAINTENAA